MSRNKARSVWLVIFVWCLLFVLLLVARFYTFRSPIVHDEGVFLYGGMAWAAGEQPYRDFWDHKPPGITLFHSIPIRLFGYSLLGIRIHEVFWLAISATIFFYVCRAHLSAGAAVCSVLFYCLLVSSRLVIRSGGLTEESALTFHALSYLFALRRRGSPGLNFFLAGLFLGVAAQFRQPFGMSIIFVVLCLLWRPSDVGVLLKGKLRLLVVLAIGAAVPELVCSSYFLLRGLWPQYIEASYLFNFFYMGGGPDVLGFREGLDKHWQMMKATGPYLASPVFVLALLWWLPRRLVRVGVLVLVAFLCDLAAISLGGRYYEHYYVQVAISSCLLLGVAIQAIYGRMPRRAASKNQGPGGENDSLLVGHETERAGATRRWLRTMASLYAFWCAAALLYASGLGIKHYVKNYRAGLAEKSRPGTEAVRQESLAEAVKTLTETGERILLMGASPTSVYFASERLAGSRYYHLSPFFRKAFFRSLKVWHRDRFLRDLQERKPVLIILAREERQISFGGTDVIKNSAAAFLLPYVERHYISFRQIVPSFRRIRWDLGWSWYGAYFSFLIREDMVEEVARRLEEAGNSEK